MPNNSYNNHNTFNHYLKKDLIKSIVFHVLLVIGICVIGLLQNNNTLINVKIAKHTTVPPAQPSTSNAPTPIQATLIDRNALQQIIKRQENQAAEKIAQEKKLQHQEQHLAKLTKTVEQEALKAKQDSLKAKQDALKVKQELEQLKKEKELLQKSADQLKLQAKQLATQQAKMGAAVQPPQKKNLTQNHQSQSQKINPNNKDSTSLALEDTILLQTEINKFHDKWYTQIVNNRKRSILFDNNLKCSIKIKLLPNGHIALVKIDKSSGNAAYDAFSEQAIYKSAPFDMPEDPRLNKEFIENDIFFDFDDSSFNNNAYE